MRRMMFKLAINIIAIVFAFATFAACDCSGTSSPEGPNTIEISYSLGGFGDAWINEAIEEFNSAYKSKGYSAVLGRSDAAFGGDTLEAEIRSYQDNTYDLYITLAKNSSNLVDSSYSTLKERDKALLEDLTDVYNSKVINLDGSEGDQTVIETRNENMLIYNRYLGDLEYAKNKYYSYQWTMAYAGVVVNTKVLSDFGYDHAPRTTREMKTMCDNILSQHRRTDKNREIYPITWGGSNTSGYFEYPLLTWLAQYLGIEGYNDFYALKPKTGTTFENGYDVYDDDGILFALSAMETFANESYAAEGSVATIDHLMSDQTLADGEAAFEITGGWMYTELINLGYSDEDLSSIEIIPVPVVSELADKIGLSGTAEQKDAALSNIIKGIDDGKTDAQIVSELSDVTAEMVARVREARGIYYDLGCGHQAYIPSYSDAKDVAKLFLRFIASKEFSDSIFAGKANSFTSNGTSASSATNFMKSMTKVCRAAYSTPIAEADCLSKIRTKGGITFTFEPMPSYVELAKGMAVGLPEYRSETVYNKVKDAMRSNWETILYQAKIYA